MPEELPAWVIEDRALHPERYRTDEEQVVWEQEEAERQRIYEEEMQEALDALVPEPPKVNEHGVEGFDDGDGFIPSVCGGCDHFSGPEYGDYGTQYGWSYCMLGLFFPVRKGTCKKFEPHGTRYEQFKMELSERK